MKIDQSLPYEYGQVYFDDHNNIGVQSIYI